MKYRTLSGPVSVQVEITEACNLNCMHCYNHWRDESEKQRASSLDEVKLNSIVEMIVEMKAASVTLTGGEPLLRWRILPTAIKKLMSAGMNVGLNSNLTLLTDEIATALKASGLKGFLVSVLCSQEDVHDSIAGRVGAWEDTIKGIKLAKSHGFRISSNMVLTKLNWRYLRETAEFLKGIGVSSFCATKASPSLNARNFDQYLLSRDELRASLEELIQIRTSLGMAVDIQECYPLCLIGDTAKFESFARRSCSAGVTTCTISPTGDVRPCSHADMVYGNVFREPFNDVWARMDDWRDGRYVPDECNACKFLERCTGGCRMEAKHRGDIRGKDPFMSGPEDVLYSIGPKHEHAPPAQEKFHLNKPLKIRKENFGATVITPAGSALINEDGLRILQGLLQESIFTVDSAATRFSSKPDNMRKFLLGLVRRGVVRAVS